MVTNHRELDAYRKAFDAAMAIFELTKCFPKVETYSLIDQIRRSSRSVCANLAEAWQKRRYKAAFVAKLCDCEGEAAETQVWLEFSVKCGYAERDAAAKIYGEYDEVFRLLVSMIRKPEIWLLASP